MPRKPTLLARAAKDRLQEMVVLLPDGEALPILAKLGEKFDVHPSTVFRILRDLVTEGAVWQSASGKFYPAAARAERVRGLPICFIGREMWQWSRLYQELLEGVSEVCSANASPLVLLSAPSLVRQPDPLAPPRFAGSAKQKSELRQLLPAIPRSCGGILFDHLWQDSALGELDFGTTPTVQFVHGSGKLMPVVGPDYEAATNAAAHFVQDQSPASIHLIIPFKGDPAIDHAVKLLRHKFMDMTIREIVFAPGEMEDLGVRGAKDSNQIFICPEDNIAHAQAEQFSPADGRKRHAMLFATQGTGTLQAPVSRLRFDFRRIGKAAVSSLLHGTHYQPINPALLHPPSIAS